MPEVAETEMTERQARLSKRNESIREDFNKGWKRGFRMLKIVDDLTEKYHLDAYTIEAIVRKKKPYNKF